MVLNDKKRRAIIFRYEHNESYRTIAKTEHVSFREITDTVKKYEAEKMVTGKRQNVPIDSSAFPRIVTIVDACKEFEKGEPLARILIRLKLEDPEQLKKWYFEYLDLKNLGEFRRLYETLGSSRILVVEENLRLMEKEGVSEEENIRRLRNVRDHEVLAKEVQSLRSEHGILEGILPDMRRACDSLRSELYSLEAMKKKELADQERVRETTAKLTTSPHDIGQGQQSVTTPVEEVRRYRLKASPEEKAWLKDFIAHRGIENGLPSG